MKKLSKPENFLKEIFENLVAKKLIINDLLIDHICYRVATDERYLQLKNKLEKENILLTESKINGRNISVFKLKQPIKFQHWEIPLLELPSPKPGRQYTEGWEHIECVIEEKLESFIEKHADLDFDLKGFSKPLNREIRLKLGKYNIKFHELSLEEVVRIEKSQ